MVLIGVEEAGPSWSRALLAHRTNSEEDNGARLQIFHVLFALLLKHRVGGSVDEACCRPNNTQHSIHQTNSQNDENQRSILNTLLSTILKSQFSSSSMKETLARRGEQLDIQK